jgi:hypothetical protein
MSNNNTAAPEYIKTFTNEFDDMESNVYYRASGEVGVRLVDLDSGEVVDFRFYPANALADAIAYAESIVGS